MKMYDVLTLEQVVTLMNDGCDCYCIERQELRVGHIKRIELVGNNVKVFISDFPTSSVDIGLIGKTKKHAKILRLVRDIETLDMEITIRKLTKEDDQKELSDLLQEEKENVGYKKEAE
jgi:hypothetical protein